MDDSNQRVGVPPYYVVPQPQDKPEEDQAQGPKVEQQQQQQQDQLQQPQELQQPQWEVSQQQQYNPFGFNFSPQVQPHPEQQQLAGNAPHPAPHPYMQYPAYYPPTTGYGGHPYGQFPPQQYDAHSQVVHHSPPPGSEGSPNIQPEQQQQLQLGQQQPQPGQQQPQFHQHPQVVQQSFHHSYAPPHHFSAGWVPPGYYPNSFVGGQAQAAGGQSSSPDPYLPGSAPIAQSHQAGRSSSSPAPPLTQFDQAGGHHAPAYPSPPPPPPTLPPPAPAPALTTEPMIQHSELVPKAEAQGPSAAPDPDERAMPAAMDTTTADDNDAMQDIQGEINIASANDDDDIAPISPAAAAPAPAVQLPPQQKQQQDAIPPPPPYGSSDNDNNSTAPPPPYGPGATNPYFRCSPETARLHKRAVERSGKKREKELERRREAGEEEIDGVQQTEDVVVVNVHDVKHTRICVSCKKSRKKACDRQWPCDNCCKNNRPWNECQYVLTTDEVTSESEGEGDAEGGVGVRGGGCGGGGEMVQGGPPIPAATNEESGNAQAAAASVPEHHQEQQEQPVPAVGPALNVSLTQDQLAQLLASNPAGAQLLAQMQAAAGGEGE